MILSFSINNFSKLRVAFAVMVLFVAKTDARIQNKRIDSLYAVIKNASNDTVKANAHMDIAGILMKEDSSGGLQQIKKALYSIDPANNTFFILRTLEKAGRICYSASLLQKARYYWDTGLARAKHKQDKGWQSDFYYLIANLLRRQDLSKQCIAYFDSALITAGRDEKQLASIFMSKGRAHYDNGDYKPAMDLYIKAQRLFEKNKWLEVKYGHLLHFIGSVFKRQGFLDKATEYYEKELDLARQIKNRSLEAEALYLCASMYGTRGDLDKEFEYIQKATEIFKEQNKYRMVGLMYANLSSNYADRKEYKKAIASLELALEIYRSQDSKEGIASAYENLGNLYNKNGEYKKALAYLKKAMDATSEIETKQLLNRTGITETMAFVYSNLGDYKSAFNTILEHRILNDSLNNQSNVEYLHELEKQYETEKKEKEIALLNAENKLRTEELLVKENQSRTLVITSLLGIVIAGISITAFMSKRKTSRILSKQVNEINYQNLIIKEKNKDITDSIQYAKRLQEAVFPEAETLNNYFAESFILFRPKDIVSGDFYWFEQAGGKTILAVGDCTGHGVPGAFMSILGHNLLNQIIMEHGIHNPADILRLLDKQVSNALNKRGARREYNDGMDIAVCVIDKKEKTLSFAGANRPLVIRRDAELIELKPNKFAIGGIEDDRCKLFGKHDLQLKENDQMYLFSDGFYDQFGGPGGKKFKYRRLVEKIKAIGNISLQEQKNILAETLETWKGNLEQVDDICVIGVKI